MFDWRDNLELSRTLGLGSPGTQISIRTSEATDRCAVGRAYYAAFGHARAYAIRRLGFVSSGGAGDHGRLAAHFHLYGMPAVASRLRNLRRWRNACDYDSVVPNLVSMLSDALRNSASVIQRL